MALDPSPMRTVLGQLIEHANWASRSWVDATLIAMGEAIREAGGDTDELNRAFDQSRQAGDPTAHERIVLTALASFRQDDELRTLGLRFLKLREQFRPIWSAEAAVRK